MARRPKDLSATHEVTPMSTSSAAAGGRGGDGKSKRPLWREHPSNKSNKRSKRNDGPILEYRCESEILFTKLNQSDPVHARRIQQRRRMIAMGKNSVGYDNYLKQVPKHKRKPRSMKYPTTPDHTLDIPTKRWQGLVRAWRRALHQYDPPDLVQTTTKSSSNLVQEPKATNNDKKDDLPMSVQERELQTAAQQGLLVDMSSSFSPDAIVERDSPASFLSDRSLQSGRFSFMDIEDMPTTVLHNDLNAEADDSDDDDLL